MVELAADGGSVDARYSWRVLAERPNKVFAFLGAPAGLLGQALASPATGNVEELAHGRGSDHRSRIVCSSPQFRYEIAMQRLQVPGLPTPFGRIGLGCMEFSLDHEAETFALLDWFLEHGGNLLDTAEVYGHGASEIALGEYFRRRGGRAKVVMVTKGCVEPRLVRPEYIRNAIQKSLERLRTDTIDIYLLHRDDPTVPAGELLGALHEARQAGYIRAYGGSNWSTARLAEVNRTATEQGMAGFVVSSPHLAVATPREPWWGGCTHATTEDLNWYLSNQMLVLGWSTQCRGFFAKAPLSDMAHLADVVRVYYTRENLEKRRRVQLLAELRGTSPEQLAVAYVLSLEVKTVALVGPSTVEQLVPLMGADQLPVAEAERDWLELKPNAPEPSA